MESWTKFWLRGPIPLMLEAVWAPASLLPQFGADWVQTGPDSAEIRFADVQGIEPMQITVDAEGNPVEVWALRWTDANPERVHRLAHADRPVGGA